MKTVVGAFDTFAHAQNAVNALERFGFTERDLSVVANKDNMNLGVSDASTVDTSIARPSLGSETATGAMVGGATGLLLGLAAFAIPGLGAIAAAGWLTMTLTGAAVGAGVGLVGNLVGAGIPEEQAHVYNESIRRGGTLVVVRADDNRADDAARILDEAGAIDIDERGAAYRNEGAIPAYTNPAPVASYAATTAPAVMPTLPTPVMTTPAPVVTTPVAPVARTTNDNEVAIPVIEEELQLGKRQVQRGGVRVYTHMTETPVSESINLREENVSVERRPVNRAVDGTELSNFREGTIEVTETAEVPVVSKEARVVEEVVVSRDVMERTETVSDTVRRTDVDVQQIPGNTAATGTVHNGTVHTGTAYTNGDTRGVGEKIADAVTGDKIDDKTGNRVA